MANYRLGKNWVKTSIFISITALLFFAISQLIIGLVRVYSANSIIGLVKREKLESYTEEQFIRDTERFKHYRSITKAPTVIQARDAVTLRVPGWLQSRVLLGASITFVNGEAVERSISLTNYNCCSISTMQSTESFRQYDFSRSPVLLRKLGNPRDLDFVISPYLTTDQERRFLNYRLLCLVPFSDCNSFDRLQPSVDEMLKDSQYARPF